MRSDEDLDRAFAEVADGLGGLDLLVHSVAYAQAHDLQGRFIDTARDDFWLALDISAYSLTAMARRAEPLMAARGGGSIVTMTYLGGERAVPKYNVMGVAKAALDASMRYLAADLGRVQHPHQRGLRRPGPDARGALDPRLHDDGGDRRRARAAAAATSMPATWPEAAVYLLDAENVTGTIAYVDAGYHAMGM